MPGTMNEASGERQFWMASRATFRGNAKGADSDGVWRSVAWHCLLL